MVIANFTNNQDVRVTGLDQYDYGQVLRIQGLKLPTAVEIHFGLEETGGTTTTRIGVTKDGVTDVPIPDSMLENGDMSLDYTIYAFIYLTDDTSGKTVHRIKIQVKARSKPELLNKPEDKELFQKAIEAVNRSAKEAEGWAHGREDMPERATDNAKYYSEQASASAEEVKRVEQSVEDMVATVDGIEQQVQEVIEYAGQAKTAAENALLSEQEAKKSEEASLQHRTGAETAENNAEVAERNAKKSEQAVEQAKQLVMQMGQQVLDNKNHVDGKVEAFNRVVTDAVDAVGTVKTDAVNAIGAKGTEQTQKVADEGTKQVKAVEDKGNEVLQSIPEDFVTQMASKLDKQQGIENKGKPLVVGADGNVIPGETQGGGDINLDAEMREYMAVVKPKIKQSIINKGGTVLDTDSFKEYSKRIDEIPNNVQAAQTIPPQTKLIGAGIEAGIKLNWQDVGADGYVIVRKIGSAPTTSADGDMIFNGTFPNDGYLDTTAQKSNVYFYRIFPRNKVNQYQSATEGSIVEVSYIDRTGQKQLKDLELGDQIVFGKWDTFDRMKWLIVDKQDVRDGYVTAGCNESFPTKQFDVPENAVDNPSPDGNRKNYGNNRWAFSNANQWLNSDKPKNEWFSPQHQYDVAPPYKNQNGFLNEFTPYEKSIIVPRNNKTFRCSVDGGGYETTIDKMWLPSAYAVNLSMEMVEDGHGLEYFSDNEKRKFNGNNWWLRTINGIISTSHQLRCVSSAGALVGSSASSNYVLRPFCQLSALAYVTWSDSDKAYIFADDSQRIGV